MLDPYKQMCVIYSNGKEVGRIAAAAQNAISYIDEMARNYGSLEIKYEENELEASIGQMIFGRKTIK